MDGVRSRQYMSQWIRTHRAVRWCSTDPVMYMSALTRVVSLFQDSVIPDSFPVYHYNGLKQSNHSEKVRHTHAHFVMPKHTLIAHIAPAGMKALVGQSYPVWSLGCGVCEPPRPTAHTTMISQTSLPSHSCECRQLLRLGRVYWSHKNLKLFHWTNVSGSRFSLCFDLCLYCLQPGKMKLNDALNDASFKRRMVKCILV